MQLEGDYEWLNNVTEQDKPQGSEDEIEVVCCI